MPNKYDAIMQRLGAVVESGPATEAQLDEAKSRLSGTLPANYCEFLRDYSDCTFYDDIGYSYTDNEPTEGQIFMLYGITNPGTHIADGYFASIRNPGKIEAKCYPGLRLVRSMEGVEWIGWPEELMPIGCDQGGNQVCLALFGLCPGAILFWVNAPGEGYDNVYLIADSFDDFMHLLRKYED